MLDESEILLTISQLAIGVAGFSGIAVVFKRKPGPLSDAEVYRVALLFANATAAMFIPLFAFPLHLLLASPTSVWRVCSAITALFSAIFVFWMLRHALRLFRRIPQLFNLYFMGFMSSGHIINVVVQAANVFGLWGARQSAVFMLGVLWLLFHSMLQFGRILFVQPPGLEPEPEPPAELAEVVP
jgi:hypothetical protein